MQVCFLIRREDEEAMSKKMTTCKTCGKEIAAAAKVCPGCGAKNKKPIFKKWWFWAIVVILVAGAGAGSGESEMPPANSENAVVDGVSNTPANEATTGANSEDTTSKIETLPEEDKIPTEYKSALKKAKSYSDTMHMSKAGIYNQLVSEYGEQFTEEAAQYAMDNLVADYKANALAKAKSYSDTMHMSKAGIYDQLVSEYGEQFTTEEAQYAVDNLKADYNANALVKAKSYQQTMSMSPAAIRDQLVSEYGEKFTAEEADYAIANLD